MILKFDEKGNCQTEFGLFYYSHDSGDSYQLWFIPDGYHLKHHLTDYLHYWSFDGIVLLMKDYYKIFIKYCKKLTIPSIIEMHKISIRLEGDRK